MKTITREVKLYSYTFANIDVTTGQTSNMHTIERPYPMTQKAIREYCANHDGSIMVKTDEVTRKYSMPVDDFIKACEEYAARVETTKAIDN